MTGPERRLLVLTGLAHTMNHALILAFPAVLTLVKQYFETDFFRLGMVSNACYLAFGLGALPAGFLADRIGPRKVIALYLLGSAAAAGLVALSWRFAVLAVALIMLGGVASMYHPSGLALVSRGIRERVRALGYHGMFGNLGLALAPLAVGTTAAAISHHSLSLGWRLPYVGLLVVAVALAVPFLRSSLGPAGERALSGPSGVEPRASSRGPAAEANAAPPARDPWTSRGKENGASRLSRLKSVPLPLVLVYLMVALNGLCFHGVVTFLPAYMEEKVQVASLGMSGPAWAGVFTSIALLAGILGQWFGGELSRVMRLERELLLMVGGSVPFLFYMGWAENSPLVLAAVLFSFFHFATQPVGNALIAHHTDEAFRSRAFGVSFFLGSVVGSFAAGICGYVGERTELSRIFPLLGAVDVLVLAVAIWLSWVGRGERAAVPVETPAESALTTPC